MLGSFPVAVRTDYHKPVGASAEIRALTALEPRSLKSKCEEGRALFKPLGGGGGSCLPSPASGGSRCLWLGVVSL